MSEEYREELFEYDEPEVFPGLSDEEIAGKIDERRRQRQAKRKRNKRLSVLVMVLIFAMLATMCGRDIVRLQAENRALKKQQAALEKQRDELKEELKNTGNREYIREQARRQLRLLNPGEILFTFDDEEEDGGSDGQ